MNGIPGFADAPGPKGLPVNKFYILTNYNSFFFRVNQAHLVIQVFLVDEVMQAHQVKLIFY
jgi:hypothetical protein